ncbi:neuropeptide Y receptor type 2, partial [Biomphalaria pfeifferi]
MDVMTFLEASTESLDTTSIFNSSSQYVTASQLGGVTNASLGYYGDNHTTRGMHIMEDAEKHRIIIICVIMA